jgi:hypothetical protein
MSRKRTFEAYTDVSGDVVTLPESREEIEQYNTEDLDLAESLPSSLLVINGKMRIRNFRISYLDAPVCDAGDVIEMLPSKIIAYGGPEIGSYAHGIQRGDDGVYTLTDPTGSVQNVHATRVDTAGKKVKRKRISAVKTQKTKSEGLRSEFKFIRVHDTGRRISKFENNLEFAEPDPAILTFLHSKLGGVPDFDPYNWCFMLSCGAVQMEHLKMYDNEIKSGPAFEKLPDPEEGRLALEKAVDFVADALQLDDLLPELQDMSIDDVRFDPTKSSGAYYRMQGYKTRGDVADLAREEARLAVLALFRGYNVAHRPTRIGGRGKPVNMSQDEARKQDVRKGRAIHMTDTRDGFILGLSEQPLNDAWKSRAFPISVGRGWFGGDCVDFAKHATGREIIDCYDAEKFDSSLYPYLIHMAITLCRNQFKNGHDRMYDAYWQFVEESLLHSFVFRDDGVMFEKWMGTSSGHNHNSVLQSIVTLILGCFCVFYENKDKETAFVRERFYMEGMGDDNIIMQSSELHADSLEDRAQRVWDVFNVSWLGKKSFRTNLVVEAFVSDGSFDERTMFGGAQYLGKYFRRWPIARHDGSTGFTVIPYRPMVETVVRMLYPEKVARKIRGETTVDVYGDERGGRWCGHMLDASGNPNTRKWLYDLRDFCDEHGFDTEMAVPLRMLKRWKRMGVEADIGSIDWDKFAFEHWLALVAYDRSEQWLTLEDFEGDLG